MDTHHHSINDDDGGAERTPLLSHQPAQPMSVMSVHSSALGPSAADVARKNAAERRARASRWLAGALLLLIVALIVMAIVLVVIRPSPYRNQVAATYRLASGAYVSVAGVYSPPDAVASFYSIPYAAPPVGGRRWSPPVDYDTPWQGQRDAMAPGMMCPQAVSPIAPMDRQSEDCLTLDVHSPLHSAASTKQRNLTALVRGHHSSSSAGDADADVDAVDASSSPAYKLRPVMVFIHGGSLIVGCSTCLHGSPRRMAMAAAAGGVDDGFVSVSINYRLNTLGFLALEALKYTDPRNTTSGNYGFLDMIAALRWVHENIEAFGGDPHRVTVWGQSSGGTAVYALLASPAARPYFSSAIALSGSPRLTNTVEQAYEQNAAAVLPLTGECSNKTLIANTTRLLDCLYSLTARQLVAAMPAFWGTPVYFGWPTRREYDPTKVNTAAASVPYLLALDGPNGVLPHALPAAFELGSTTTKQVPTLIGGMHDEFDLLPNVVYNSSVTFKVYERSLERAMEALEDDTMPELWAQNVRTQYSGGKNATDRPDGKGYPPLQTPQQAYSSVSSDPRLNCPNFRVAAALRTGRAASQPTSDAPVYVYNMLFKPTFPYCVARFITGDTRAYCAHYAFHMLDYLLAVDDSLFTSPLAGGYGRVRDRHFAKQWRALIGEFVASGGRIARFAEYPAINTIDMANSTSAAFELRNSTEFKSEACRLWTEADAFDKWSIKD